MKKVSSNQFKIPSGIPKQDSKVNCGSTWNQTFMDSINDSIFDNVDLLECEKAHKASLAAKTAEHESTYKRKIDDWQFQKSFQFETSSKKLKLNGAIDEENGTDDHVKFLESLEVSNSIAKDRAPSPKEDYLALSQYRFEENCNNISNIEIPSEFFQCSQQFLSDIIEANSVQKSLKSSQQISDKSMLISKNNLNGSEYIQRQREMHEINVENIDDDFIDSDLSQIYKSTQYRQGIEDIFDKCEFSICKLDNIEGQSAAPVSLTQIQRDAINEIHNIDWNQDFESPLKIKSTSLCHTLRTPSAMRQKLNELHQRRLTTFENIGDKIVNFPKFVKKGPFFGLPMIVKTLIKEFKGIDNLYNWQTECLNLSAIASRNNLIYSLPTSGGKTLVAEILLLRELLCYQKNVLFILPFVSIVQEKVWSLSPFAVALNFLVEEYAAGKGTCPPRKRRQKKSVFVCTIEKGLVLFNSLIESGRANEIGLIVVDELHLVGEPGRGVILEMLLAKAMFLNVGIQIIGMSATIGNLQDVATFMNADVYTRDFRPVELQEYIKCGTDLLKINSQAPSLEESFQFSRTIDFEYSADMKKVDPDQIAGLVMEIIPKSSCLVFCFSKKNCESVALLLCQIFGNKYFDVRASEKKELMRAISRDTSSPLCKILRQTIPSGVAYHHSGLVSDERKHLEDAFRMGILCVICCTSTLAAGVNLPAKRVILRSPYVGRNLITLSKYKQMVGRAGRAGLGDAGESILVCQPKDNARIGSLLYSPMDEAMSGMLNDNNRGIRSLILSAVGLGLADTRTEIKRLVSKTLLQVQAKRLGANICDIIDSVLKYLFRKKALQIKGENITRASNVKIDLIATQGELKLDSQAVVETDKTVKLLVKNSTQFEISKIGKAAVRASMDLEKANILYKELMKALQSVNLVDYLHLLYIVTPQEKANEIQPNVNVYTRLYVSLSYNQLQTTKILGIPESCAVKMMAGKSFKPEVDQIVRRFFVTLMIQDLWDLKSVLEVADKFQVERGYVQSLINIAATNASSILRFCEEMDELWALRELLTTFTKRLSYCCTNELIPLMELPSVKIGRAKQLFTAGYTNLECIAKAKSSDLVDNIEFMSHRVAKQLIAAAKLLLLERVETLREAAQDVLDVLDNTTDNV